MTAALEANKPVILIIIYHSKRKTRNTENVFKFTNIYSWLSEDNECVWIVVAIHATTTTIIIITITIITIIIIIIRMRVLLALLDVVRPVFWLFFVCSTTHCLVTRDEWCCLHLVFSNGILLVNSSPLLLPPSLLLLLLPSSSFLSYINNWLYI